MVEDSEIKAKISPFAVRANEIKKFDGKDGYVSMSQIINKINIKLHPMTIKFTSFDEN